MNSQLGWGFLLVGILSFVVTGLAIKFGKRPAFLISNISLLCCSIWAFAGNGWTSLVVSQIMESAGTACYITLVNATIADLYFL